MVASHDPNNPMGGRISIPRMITAQFDSIGSKKILSRLVPETTKAITSVTKKQKHKAWFTIYLVMFLLLHQVAIASKDRRRWACANQGTHPLVR
jgi:hypothetical protein